MARKRVVPIVVVVMVVLASLGFAGASPAAAAPGGFSLEPLPFAGLIEPSAVEFASTGQVFVAERRGVIKMFDNLDATTGSTVADLRLRVFNGGDRGLLGMALDPQYPARPYLWALYTKNADVDGTAPKYGSGPVDTDTCPDADANDCRVSGELTRLTLDPLTGTWTGAEKVLLSQWCQQFGSHSIGSVVFGPDGYLYVSAGDGASYFTVDIGNQGTQRCTDPAGNGGALRAQSPRRSAGDPTVLNGTVLRLEPDTGLPAPGNPYASDPSALKQRVLAYGLRNPFRIAPRPGTSEMWVADVGWTAWEELNKIDIDATAENFGWPCYEGTAAQPGYDAANQSICETLYGQGPAAVVSPQLTYNHGATLGGNSCPSGGSSISALAFSSTATAYPAAYQGGIFFGDYSRRCLWYAPLNGSAISEASVTTFDNTAYPAQLKAGPSGDIYIVDIVTNQIKRIRYTAGGNTPPIAIARANPSSGRTPLPVQFDGGGSSDPDAGSSLSYAWDLDGDGQFDDSTAVTPTWTYSTAGAVVAKLRVTDNAGSSTIASVTITAGSAAPVPKLTSIASSTPWKVGDTISFTASATDAEDGNLPPQSLSTRLVVKHCPGGANCHEHVQQTFIGAGGSFVAPDHEYPSWLELQLSATDSSGITATTSLRLDPATVNLTIDSVPSNLQAVVGPDQRTTPFTVPVIKGSTNTIAVPSPQVAGSTYDFTSWSDGGGQSHDVVANADKRYVATFTQTGGPSVVPGLVGAWSFNEGSGTTAADSSGHKNVGTLQGGPTWTAAGKHGGALTFDGVNDDVSIPDSASLDLTTAMTLTAWVRPTTLGAWRQALLKEQPGGLDYALYATGASGNRPNGTISVGGDRPVDALAAFPANAWTHLALSYDGATMRLYVNGTQVATRAQTGAMATSASPLRIGGNSVWGEWFAGQIDEARVYNRALTPAEIVTDSNSAGTPDTVPPTTPTGLVATGGLNSVSVAWTRSTDNAATPTYEVHRSLVSGFNPVASTRIASGVTNPSYVDTPLGPGTYYYRVVASDGSNLSPASAQATATVTGDTVPPSVPSGLGVAVHGATATVTWAASTDNVGVLSYQLQRKSSAGTTTFLVPAPATTLSDPALAAGSYTYALRANDQAGNWSAFSTGVTATVVADVAPPTVSVTAPAGGATVSGAVPLSATAADDVGVAGVQFRVDGTNVGSEDTIAPYQTSWTSGAVANGTHVITAVARDASGKSTMSAAVSVKVANSGPPGLVGAWAFNEGTGTKAGDSSGHNNVGTLEGGPTWTTAGKHGGAVTFDGVNDWVSIPDSASLQLTTGMTIAAWVRPTALGAWREVLLKERPGGLAYSLYATGASGNRPNGTISVGGTDRVVATPTAIAANTWTHLAVTYDGTTMRLYVNGAQVATQAQTGAMATSTNPLRIGGNSVWGEWFSGQIDQARVYNRALTAAEIVTVRDAAL